MWDYLLLKRCSEDRMSSFVTDFTVVYNSVGAESFTNRIQCILIASSQSKEKIALQLIILHCNYIFSTTLESRL